MSSSIAVFDFDKTLTRRDCFLPFLFYKNGFWKTLILGISLMPDFVKYAFKRLSRQEIKEKILTCFLRGQLLVEIQALGQQFAEEQLDRYLRPQAIKRLAWHQAKGHRCIIASASVGFYLIPWAKKHGFEEALTSCVETTPDGKITGKLVGLNCWGIEKERRLVEYLDQPKENLLLYVYGDSRGDQEILALADYSFFRTFE